MNKEFDFSQLAYEFIRHESCLPFKIFFVSVGFCGFHWHKDFELILVLKGTVNLVTSEKSIILSEGDLNITNPNEFHGLLQGKGGNLLLVLQIDPDMSHSYPQNLNDFRFDLPPYIDKKNMIYKSICRSICLIMKEAYSKNKGFDYVCMSEIYRIISLLIRNFSSIIADDVRNEEKMNKIGRLKKMLDFINQNHQDSISLQDLADELGLSPFYVSHLIKDYTGSSFQETLGMVRTQHAMKLMMNSSERLIDIALEAGFSDIRYFNKYFRRLFSMSPHQLRKTENWQKLIINEMSGSDNNIANLLPEIDAYL